MPRILLSCIIGFFSFFASFAGAELFEVPGKNSVQENVSGCVALILYMVLGQFLLPRDPTADTAEDWRARASMAAPLVLFALLVLTTEGEKQFLPQVWMLAAGCIGVLSGGLLARLLTRSAQADAARAAGMSKLLGAAGTSLYVGVSVILFAFVVPARHGSASSGMMVIAVLHLVLAAAVLWRTRKGKVPILPATFGFLMTLTFAGIGAADAAHGHGVRLASITLFVCAAMDMVVWVWCAVMAIQHPDAPALLEGHQ
jgi:hypothetical protein